MNELKKIRKIKSTRNIPLIRLEDEDVKAFLFAGWRVCSRRLGIRVSI